ncbi:MAG: DsbC family protein [bacterium]
MKKILSLCLLAISGLVLAQDSQQHIIEASLQKLIPGAKVESIAETPINDLYEVVVNGQLVYISKDGKYLVQGSLFDVERRIDLTEGAKSKVRKAAIANLDLSQSITFKAKNQKHEVVVFTDIDCGYCRKLHSQIAQYNADGLTIHYLFFPRAGIGSESYNKAVSVWCSDDQKSALTNAKTGTTPEAKSCANPVKDQYELGKKVGVTGTPAIMTLDGQLIAGYMPPERLLPHLDQLATQK